MDYTRLQQILTLKLIGLSLQEIKSLLTSDTAEIEHLLNRQKQVLKQQVTQLSRVIQTIEEAQISLNASQVPNLEQFVNIIKAVNMNTQEDWFAQFITDEQKKKLVQPAENQTIEAQKQAGEAWKSLFSDVIEHMHKGVNDANVQTLVDRWDNIINQYAQGDADLAAGLVDAYVHLDTAPDVSNAPGDVREWVDSLREAVAFLDKAREAKNNHM